MERYGTDVIVVGAGVSGLTTAACLAEAGLRVRVIAREFRRTASAAAGALWGPYLVTHEQVKQWSMESLAILEGLAERDDTGVALVTGVEAARTPTEPPDWTVDVRDFTRCRPEELPRGFVSGWRYTVPVIDMTRYLPYLSGRLEAAGVGVTRGTIDSFADPRLDAPVIVNCTGLGARELVPDEQLTPIRGQLVIVENPGIDEFFADHDEDPATMTYILPQGPHVVLGGSAEPGKSDLEPDPATTAAILGRCLEIDPRLRDARVIDVRVGLRPNRPVVRVEQVPLGDRQLIHNYGHGGSGVSLSWGCARHIEGMIRGL